MRAPEIRAALHAHIDRTAVAGSVVVDEYGIRGATVVDVAVFEPQALHLFEIKSDADSVNRLRFQTQFYPLCGPSTCTLVSGPRLIEKAAAKVPAWWGVMLAEDTAQGVLLSTRRAAQPNPESDPRKIASVLWSTESWAALKARGLSKGKSHMGGLGWEGILAEALAPDQLRALVFDAVRARKWFASRTPVRVVGQAA